MRPVLVTIVLCAVTAVSGGTAVRPVPSPHRAAVAAIPGGLTWSELIAETFPGPFILGGSL